MSKKDDHALTLSYLLSMDPSDPRFSEWMKGHPAAVKEARQRVALDLERGACPYSNCPSKNHTPHKHGNGVTCAAVAARLAALTSPVKADKSAARKSGEPSAAELAALKRFAKDQGPRWKEWLRKAWEGGTLGRVAAAEDVPLLQAVRNKLGPSGLAALKL